MTAPAATRPGLLGALALLVALTLSSCASGSPEATRTPAAETPAPAASTCVGDPAGVFATAESATSSTAPLPADLAARLGEAATAAYELDAAPGAIVGVRTPEGTWTAAYGVADPSVSSPMTTDHHMRVGSITKTFTVTVLLQLAEDGDLSLDDTIGEYIPDIPNGDVITLRQLTNMTSGVASYTKNEAFTDRLFAAPTAVYSPDELVAAGVEISPLFEPGTDFEYSNTNTVLLGLVIEQVAGKPIGDVLADRIFEPLALADTSWPGESAELPEPYARGFTLQGDAADPANPADATNWNPSSSFTAGEVISTVSDMLVFTRALGTGQGLVDEASQVERLSSFSDTTGYGIGLVCVDGWVGHTGTLPGYTTTMYYDTTSDTSVVVLVSSDIASGACETTPTLTDDPGEADCLTPALRIFEDVSTALGHTYTARRSG